MGKYHQIRNTLWLYVLVVLLAVLIVSDTQYANVNAFFLLFGLLCFGLLIIATARDTFTGQFLSPKEDE